LDIFAADISDLNDIRIFTVCDHPARQYDPAISGRLVVWTDERNDGGDIYGADLTDLSDIREMEIVKKSGVQQQPAIDGGTVVYAEGRGYSGTVRLACVTRRHGVLDTDLPRVQSGTSPCLDGTTLVVLQGVNSSVQGFALGTGYSIFDGPVRNSRTGARYDYIQHAIAAAERGDESLVGQGCYTERINYGGKAVTVRSADPADPAVVAATALRIEGDVVTFAALEDANSVLDGLTITGGYSGILCSATSPVVTRCNVTANRGAGMRLLNQSNVTMSYCNVTGNDAAGVDLWATRQGRVVRHSQATFHNCLIAGNRLQGISSGRVTITNCTIVENLREGVNSISPVVTNSVLYSNGRDADNIQIGGSYATVSFSDIEGGWDGDGNIDADPCFVKTGNWVNGTDWIAGDYHLKSRGVRWDSLSSSWVSDDITSPCIDAGDPAYPLVDEPVTVTEEPSGQQYVNTRIDMGVYGGTPEASLKP
jgi:beta propeller repeat protein